jgi:hypothetical protein
MTARHVDELLALGEKMKADVKESSDQGAEFLLPQWMHIEKILSDQNFDLMAARENIVFLV